MSKPGSERKLEHAINRMAKMLLKYECQLQCSRLDFIELKALLDEEPGPEFEIAEAAIARAKMRGIE